MNRYKDKAVELIDQMVVNIPVRQDEYGHKYVTEQKVLAARCALIAVDYIIGAENYLYQMIKDWGGIDDLNYWGNIKAELALFVSDNTCYCGQPVDDSSLDTLNYKLCKEHEDDV